MDDFIVNCAALNKKIGKLEYKAKYGKPHPHLPLKPLKNKNKLENFKILLPKHQKNHFFAIFGLFGLKKRQKYSKTSIYKKICLSDVQKLSNVKTNCLKKSFMGYRVCKNWLLGTEGAKIAIEPQKRVSRGSKIRKSTIFQQL